MLVRNLESQHLTGMGEVVTDSDSVDKGVPAVSTRNSHSQMRYAF